MDFEQSRGFHEDLGWVRFLFQFPMKWIDAISVNKLGASKPCIHMYYIYIDMRHMNIFGLSDTLIVLRYYL